MNIKSRKAKRKIIVASVLLTLGLSALAGYFTSRAFAFERETGGHYLGEIEPEIKGVYAHKLKTTPTDNKYNTQKNYSMSILGDIESVWDYYKGAGTTVAIIDDGFDANHPEYVRSNGTSALSNDSAYFYSSGSSYGVKYFKNDSTCLDQKWDSDYSEWDTHGTNTSTTAAAPMNNGGGVGIAPEATILALKIDMSFVAIRAAINYAISKNVDVINMSLGAFAENFTDGFGESQTGSSSTATYLNSVCQSAYDSGIIVVAAAGNEATWHKSYPACNSHVIGVGALEENDANTLAAFTNYVSASQTGEVNVDILAPGYVYTAHQKGTQSSITHTYDDTQGTSFSSPIVAGAACLWKEKNPNGTPDEFLSDLQASAAGIGDYYNKYVPVNLYGSGYTKQGPSNITQGRLDVGALMLSSKDVTGVTMSQTSMSLYTSNNHNSGELSANIQPANANDPTINWTISDSTVATLSKSTSTSGEKIVVTAKKAGTATITARSNENSSFSATCALNVQTWVPVTGISLVDTDGLTSKTIEKRQTIQLVPTVSPANATNNDFIVESHNTSIATVDSNYVVKGISPGTTTIEALIENDAGDDYLSATYTVTVISTQGTGTLLIDLYDSSTLSDSNSTNGLSMSALTNKVTVDDVINNDAVTSYSGTNAYLRKGGLALGTSKKSGECTFIIDHNYPISSVIVTGASWNTTSGLTLNGNSGTGSLNDAGTTLNSCTETLVFDNLNDVTSLTFASSNRAIIYQIECECEVPAGVAVTGISLSQTAASLDVYNNQSVQLTATITPNNASNKTVTWSTSDSSVATVNNGLIIAKGVGSAVITATTNNGLSATCNVTVTDSTPSVTPDPTPTSSGNFEKITSTSDLETGDYLIVYEDGDVAFDGSRSTLDATSNTIPVTISNDSIAYSLTVAASKFTIDSYSGGYSIKAANGSYIGRGANSNGLDTDSSPMKNTITFSSGDAVITGTGGRKLCFNTAADQQRFRYMSSGGAIQLYKLDLGPTLNGVSLDKNALSLDVYNNTAGSLQATVDQDDGVTSTLSWSSSNTDVALVTSGNISNPTVTAIGQGTAVITVTATYNEVVKTATCNVTVIDSTPIPVTGLSLNKESISLNNVDNKTTTLSAVYTPGNANQIETSWVSSDSNVVSVSSSTGSSITLTAHESGVAIITATCNGYMASCSVTVSDVLVTNVSLNKTESKLFNNDTVTLTATITPSQVTNNALTWETSDSSIASLSATSSNSVTVTGHGDGGQTAIITVRTTDGSNKSAICTITIVELTSITFQDLPTSVAYKSTFSLGSTKVIAHYSDDTSKDVTSSATINTSLVNTSVLGLKNVTASYTEKGVTKDVTGQVKVTNNGASGNVGVSYSTETGASVTSTFTAANWVDANSMWSTSSTTLWNNTQGIQISKNQNGSNATTVSSYNKVSSVVVSYSTNASAGAGNIAIQVGTNSSMSRSVSTQGGTTARDLTFTPASEQTGNVKITVTCTTNSIYIKSVTINYKTGTTVTFPATPTEQAQAWANYFLNKVKGYCSASGEGSDVSGIASVWEDLSDEYGYMTNDSKDAFVNGTSSEIVEARQLYSLVFSKYHSQLNDDNFVTDGSDIPLATSNYGRSIIASDSGLTIISIISMTTLVAFSLYFFVQKKKKQ